MTDGELVVAMERFATMYHARSDLVAEQRGWNCVIALVATDSGEAVVARIEDGRIASCGVDRTPATVTVTSDAATLLDILALRRGPNEPYVFGELTVSGPEADFLRLDYVTAVMCPE